MKIERDSARGAGSFDRPGRSLLGERRRSTATLDGAVRPGGGGVGVVADARLLQHYSRDGDQSAFTSLVEKYQSMVIGTAFRHTRNAELAREVAQEVFAALARKARTLARRYSLAGWLHRAALYESVHVLKAETRRCARNERYSSQMAIFTAPRANESRSAERLAVIDEALDDLPENDREALVLHYFQDLSYAEMAKALALSEPAVRQRVSRALHHLELALRSRGYSGNAVVLLLAVVATHSSLAIPTGLSTAALALAKSGATSSLPLFLSGLLPKTSAVILAVAGMALLWQTSPPAPLVANAASNTSPAQTPVAELPSDPQPVRVASAERRAHATRETNLEASLPVVAHQSALVRHRARPPEPPEPPEPAEPAEPPEPAKTRAAPVARSETRPASVHPGRSGDLPSATITRAAAEAPEALETIVEAFPRLAWELRAAELFPLEAANLYTRLLTQVLALNHSQQLSVEEFLVGHYAQLRERNIAGPRPPDFPRDDWHFARKLAVEEAIAGIEAAVEGDVPVARDVLTLADELDASPEIDLGDGTIIDL